MKRFAAFSFFDSGFFKDREAFPEKIKQMDYMILKNLPRLGCFMVVIMMLAGCFEGSTVVRLNADGSGTVSEKMMMTSETLAQMQSVGENSNKEKPGGMPEKETLEKKSGDYGEGVTFIGVHPVRTKTHEGYEAVYAFSDINRLRVSRNPDKGTQADSTSETAKKEKQYVRFSFQKGSPSRLLIMMDQDAEQQATSSPSVPPVSASTPEQQKMMAGLMKQFFKGMRISLAVDIDGLVLGTNAMHRKGNRITLVEMDFDRLLAHPKQLAAFNALGPNPSANQMQKILRNIPGIRVEGQKEVEVRFR